VLGHAIVAGEFPRGVLPIEPELERRFAVSRSVVREAVKMLAAKGWSSRGRARGPLSSPDTAWNLFDPLVLRWMVEGAPQPEVLRQLCEFSMSIEPAAAACRAGRLGKAIIRGLAAACDRLAGSEGHPSASLDAAIALHHAIVVASGNVFYLRTGDAVGAAHRVLARHGGWRRPAGFPPRYGPSRARSRRVRPSGPGQEMTALLERVFEPIALGRPAAA
jgi:DNA-binding FadR family transcriptional regulator